MAFFRKNMALIRFIPFHLAAAGNFKPFLGAAIGLHFRHNSEF
jgi:hypothetical protein